MGLTVGLDTALSGLLASQQALNVISDNIANVNTPGYTRKVDNLESVVLGGAGAGVQTASITRAVDEGLLKQIRAQTSATQALNITNTYESQVQNMFGQVGDSTSISSQISALESSFQQLSTQVDQPSQQATTVQALQTVTNQFNSMSSQLQSLRLQADSQLSQAVTQVNTDLSNINTLNQEIVKGLATNSSTSDLQDQRDSAITDLSKYIGIQYFQRNDGSTVIYTSGGTPLLDSQTNDLTHAATSVSQPWMSLSGGQFDKITTAADPNTDISSQIQTGQMASLLALRDSTLPNMQSELDTLASQLQTSLNALNNGGTSQPNVTNSYTGTRTFSSQGSVTIGTDTGTDTLTYNGGANTISAATTGSLAFNYSTTNGQATITAGTAGSLAGLAAGDTFTVTGSGANDGTYTVLSVASGNSSMEVAKGNPISTFSLQNGADSVIALMDSSGNQIAQTTLNTIMTTDYSGGSGNGQLQPQASGGPWSIAAFSQHLQSWIRAQGGSYSAATVGLDANGHMAINLGSTNQTSLVFRDQTSSTPGATQSPATVSYDVNGDGTPDQTVQGVSNFFGLNDLLVTNGPNPIMDSAIQPSNFATTTSRTLSLFDNAGQIGNTMTIPAGSTLQDIANTINSNTQTNESALQNSNSVTLTSAATITVSDANGTVVSKTVGPGTVSLQQIATTLTSGTVTGTVTEGNSSPTQYRLRLTDSRGVPLTVSFSGGTISGTATLGSQLNMTQTSRVRAEVVPDGSGYRLRVVQSQGEQLSAAATQDASGKSILTDLGLSAAATDTASSIAVRSDILGNPQAMSRGTLQWNSTLNQYYMSQGDNTTTLAMVNAMSQTISMPSAGGIASGSYSMTGYASSIISLASTDASNTQNQYTQQNTLLGSLNTQYSSTAGVNIDQEVTNMITYQQAYSASARVISVMQAMLSTLTDLVK